MRGFTLLELLIVIGIVIILIGATIAAINPARQMTAARDATRWAHVGTYANAVAQNTIDNAGTWSCSGFLATTTWRRISAADYDICSCLYPTYLGSVPREPSLGASYTSCVGGYDTGYDISWNTTTPPYRVQIRCGVDPTCYSITVSR